MAHQQKDHRKLDGKSLNLIEIFVSRGPFAPREGEGHPSLETLKVDSMKAAPLPSSQTKSACFHINQFSSLFAHKPVPWMPKAWASVCNALQKQTVFSPEGVISISTERSPENACSIEDNLEGLPPLGQQILLHITENSLARGRALFSARSCNLATKVDNFRTTGDGFASLFVGVFFQSHAKEAFHLAQRLVNGDWVQRSFHHGAFARLHGDPGLMLLHSSRSEVDLDEGQPHEESMPRFPTTPQDLLWKMFGQGVRELDHHQQQQQVCPNLEMLTSVQDFFIYTEFEGKKVFDDLDRDADGKLTVDDLKVAMKKMKLPVGYAKDFMQHRHWLWPAKDYGWPEFSSLLQEKEPMIVQLFNSLGVTKSGTVKRSHLKDSLVKMGISASEGSVTAMMKFLAEDATDGLKYGQFRRFMLLLPIKQLTQDPWSVWLKAATTDGMEHFREDLRLPLLDYVCSAYRNMQNEDLVEGQIHQRV